MRIKEIRYGHLMGIDNTRKTLRPNLFKESRLPVLQSLIFCKTRSFGARSDVFGYASADTMRFKRSKVKSELK